MPSPTRCRFMLPRPLAERGLTRSLAQGFSVLELTVVLLIMMIIGVMAIPQVEGLRQETRSNAAYSLVISQLQAARETAITQRGRIRVQFAAPGTITTSSLSGDGTTWTQLSTYTLPTDVSFQALSGFPFGSANTPDGFGNGTVNIDFGQGLAASLNYVLFMPDGSSQDASGNLNSGVVYMARGSVVQSGRAVTVWGGSGRIRGYRLTKNGAVVSWSQQ